MTRDITPTSTAGNPCPPRLRGGSRARRVRVAFGVLGVLASLCASAPVAGADLGPIGSFDFEHLPDTADPSKLPADAADAPGIVTNPTGAAVSAAGSGSASPGDVYVVDLGGNLGGTSGVTFGRRIQQFSASHGFVRLFGPDVVKSGPGNSDEVQAVRIDADSGSFKLGFGSATTADISATASASQVQAALDGLSTIAAGGGSVTVSGGPGDAGGHSPYLVTFDGGPLAGAGQPELVATNGSTPLSGGAASASVYTTNPGGTGAEICNPIVGDVCKAGDKGLPEYGGALRNPQNLALNQTNGDLYTVDVDLNRINQFSSDGHFIRAWGWDTVASGPGDSAADEVEKVAVNADGGTFRLTFDGQTTTAIPFDASAAQVQSALDALDNIGGNYSSVTVEDGPGDLGGNSPYTITFHGLLGGDDLEKISASGGLLTASAGVPSVAVSTSIEGGAFEICGFADACKTGVASFTQGAAPHASHPGAFTFRISGNTNGTSDVAVAPAGASNAGDVLIADGGANRVQEFTTSGAFVRMFGWDVVATGPDDAGNGFEVCLPANGDVCKEGSSGAGVGQFAAPDQSTATLNALAEDSSGAIYTAEIAGPSGTGERVQKFTPAGGFALTPSLFGSSEVQTVSINAAAGQFRLALSEPEGTTGEGVASEDSNTITNVSTSTGAFVVGMPVESGPPFIPYGTIITAVGPDTLTLSQTPDVAGQAAVSLSSPALVSTSDLPYDIPASGGVGPTASLENAINALSPVVSSGGSVHVAGGPGGTAPYAISFDGGSLARTDPPQLRGSQGTTPLSGGSGAGANAVNVTTSTPGGPGGSAGPSNFAHPGGTGGADAPVDVAIGPGDKVFVARNYPSGFTPCEDGTFSPAEVRIQELDSAGSVVQTSNPCKGIKIAVSAPAQDLTVNQTTGNPYLLDSIQFPYPYQRRLYVYGSHTPAPDIVLDPAVSNAGPTGGTISGTIDPNGPGESYPDATGTPSSYQTTYRVEYKKSSESNWTRYSPDTTVGSGTSAVAFSVGVTGLNPKTPYDLRVVATKPLIPGGTVTAQQSFTTVGAPPVVSAFHASGVALSSADLHALINPQGSDTTYHFDYGTSIAYDHSTPEAGIGDALDSQEVTAHISDLQDTTYHFRVVATNSFGNTTTDDQTFVFHPPSCPNQTVRQQTNAGYLPDCRAYELVSPENAGGTTLYTGGPQSAYATSPSRLAFVGQFGEIPGAGATPINNAGDLYVATRGASGWSTKYIGLPSSQAGCMGGRPITSAFSVPTTVQNDVMSTPDLGRFINWNLGNPAECVRNQFGAISFYDFNTAAQGSNSPYLWNANGDLLDRWPTDLGAVSGAAGNFACPQDPSVKPYPPGSTYVDNIPVSYFCSTFVDASKDLSHFVFSTASGLFGEGGLTTAPGSAYVNNTATGALTLISKDPSGNPIAQEPGSQAGPEELIKFPNVSNDGTHILMGTAVKAQCRQVMFPLETYVLPNNHTCPLVGQPSHLYMRVNDALTYDVSADHTGVGQAVTYVGSTGAGSKVYFTTAKQMTADDTDQSMDLYMWDENNGSPQLTRLSAGNALAGDTDNCNATWTTRCDVKVYDDSTISATNANKGGLGNWNADNPNPGYTDNSIAAKSGDIFFYSPEQLVAGKGAPGKQNVYDYHDGSLQFVATLSDDPYCIDIAIGETSYPERHGQCSDGPLGRLQVTPDGRYAAFVTTSRITPYDNGGHAEMYRYDAKTEAVLCMSCNPDGGAPSSDVLGSMGGRFITDDGRVFFDTEEALDQRDSNSGKDTYEFVNGQPQLITTGTGSGGLGRGFAAESVPGFYGVSADGTDAYFGTFEALVGQDRNGSGQLKFYDARTNGGFAFNPPPQPCAAADECHGDSSTATGPLVNGTGAALGSGGNHRASPKKHRRHKKHRKHRRNRHGLRTAGGKR